MLVYYSGSWKAFSAICTHAGCANTFTGSTMYCPCHGATFSPANGAVLSGPTRIAVAQYDIQIVNSNIYVSPSRIN
jgi:Rieske Fe-S protein